VSGDPRVTPLREGLASRALEGIVPAGRYVDPVMRVAAVPAAALRRRPEPGAEQLDQLLFGEPFAVLDEAGGFAWGQAPRDGYVGYVALADLATPSAAAPTHRIAALHAYAFDKPDIKTRAAGPYPINALIAEEAREGRFVKAVGAGWMAAEHLAPIGMFEADFVAVAERCVGAAYLWGGRQSAGLDCSGLVQLALLACGRACPRDTDQQAQMGRPVTAGQTRRGDLVFWRGHVGIVLDGGRLLHANAHHMAVAIEPLATAAERIRAAGLGEPTAYRRL
jgi:cell wall-associated NlpC family hydrolase